MIEVENQLIDLGRIMIQSVQNGKCDLDVTEICLGEICCKSNEWNSIQANFDDT